MNLVVFIGGGADKTRERFGIIRWGPTNLMGSTRAHFDTLKIDKAYTKYYCYLDRKKIVKRIVKFVRKHPNTKVNLVGHSRGGAVAKDIALKDLRKRNVKVNLLVSLDPVKAQRRNQYKIPNAKGLANIATFITVFANPLKRQPADYIALVGGQYGRRLAPFSHYFIEANVNHGKPLPMLKLPIDELGTTALDLLIQQSRS